MKAMFRRGIDGNYLQVASEGDAGYMRQMLRRCHLDGMLRFHTEEIDRKLYDCYDVTSKQPMARFAQVRPLVSSDIEALVFALGRLSRELARYLLGEELICLDKDFIFVDPGDFGVSFCVIPWLQSDFPKEMEKLFQFLLKEIDHRDKDCVVLVYGLCQACQTESCRVQDLVQYVRSYQSRIHQGGCRAGGMDVARGVTGGVAGGVAGDVAGCVTGGVTGGAVGGVTGGVTGGVARGVIGGIAGGVPGGAAGGVTEGGGTIGVNGWGGLPGTYDTPTARESSKRPRLSKKTRRAQPDGAVLAAKSPRGGCFSEGTGFVQGESFAEDSGFVQASSFVRGRGLSRGGRFAISPVKCVVAGFLVVLATMWFFGGVGAWARHGVQLAGAALVCAAALMFAKIRNGVETGDDDGGAHNADIDCIRTDAPIKGAAPSAVRPQSRGWDGGDRVAFAGGIEWFHEEPFAPQFAHAGNANPGNANPGNANPGACPTYAGEQYHDGRGLQTTGHALSGGDEPSEQYHNGRGLQTTLLAHIDDQGSVPRLLSMDGQCDEIVMTYFPFVIGKQETMVDFAIKRDAISRLHARFDKEGDSYYVTDLNTTNGIWVDGRLLEANAREPICANAEIRLADTSFRFLA